MNGKMQKKKNNKGHRQKQSSLTVQEGQIVLVCSVKTEVVDGSGIQPYKF